MDTRTTIHQNLVYLEQNITDLPNILPHLIQNNIISQNEREEIESEKTQQAKNSKLLRILQKKDLPINTLIDILRATSNQHCANKIQGFLYLAENITNVTEILMHLMQDNIISKDERKEIEVKETTMIKNVALLNLMQRKGISLEIFLGILRKTNNEHCADAIEGIENQEKLRLIKPKILRKKWWPIKKILTKSLQKRKIGDKLIIEELHHRISKDDNRMVVICESVDASKLTALGGVGKTLTATWYGHHYENTYDHIIWIDCGEDSLLASFKSLAMDLKIENIKEFLKVEQFARKSYEALEEFKCLWIFDNAESYQGEEGIKDILPKLNENFYCVITSRSLDWGIKNVGFGNISRLELSIFGKSESLEFLKTHLNEEIQHTEYKLKELSSLLGHLPLALQLAIAALNMGKIDLQNYIEETSSKDVGNIVETKFDDYEKTINGNVKISLHLIANEQNGKVAKDILMILGYIRPDNIQAKFLMKIMKVELSILTEAIDLLAKYSLVNKSGTVQESLYDDGIMNKILGKSRIKIEMDLLNIHRLLQQVTRHNCRQSENETLRKILGCNGFLDYKLLPFTKYATHELRKEFPKVKAQLLDQQQLKKLLLEKRFEESVQLAKYIDKEINSTTTKFNYAVCLGENGQLEEAVNVLTPLFVKLETKKTDKTMEAEILLSDKKSSREAVAYGSIVDLGIEPTQGQITYLLFHFYFLLGRIKDVLEENVFGVLQIASSSDILKYVLQEERFGESVLLSRYIDQKINSNTTKFNYAICLQKNQQLEENIKVLEELYKHAMKEEIYYNGDVSIVEMGLLELKVEVTKSLVGGHLLVSLWTMDNNNARLKEILKERKSFVMIHSEERMTTLVRILYSNLIHSNYTLTNKGRMFRLKLGGDVKRIELWHCTSDLSGPLLRTLGEMQKSFSERVHFTDGNPKDTKSEVSQGIPKNLNTVEIYCGYSDVSLYSVSCIENITLYECSLSLDSVNRISPTKLKLSNVSFVKNGRELAIVKVNEFIDFHKMKRLKLICDSKRKNVSIDLSEESANIEYLYLVWVNVLSLKSANSNGRMNIKEAAIDDCSLDLSIFPPSLEKLSLCSPSKVFVSGGIDLPNLKYLKLEAVNMSELSHFRSFQLTYLNLECVKEVTVDMLNTLPSSKIIRISKKIERNMTRLKGEVIQLDKLILCEFRLNEVEEMMTYFHPKQLVLYSDFHVYKRDDLIQLTDKRIPTIAIGTANSGNIDFKNSRLSKQVNRQSHYYLFHEGTRKAIEKEEFEEVYLLNHIFELNF